jgi:hypothetical protein
MNDPDPFDVSLIRDYSSYTDEIRKSLDEIIEKTNRGRQDDDNGTIRIGDAADDWYPTQLKYILDSTDGEFQPTRLKHYFRFETWGVEQGLYLLCGFDPEKTFGEGERKDFARLDGLGTTALNDSYEHFKSCHSIDYSEIYAYVFEVLLDMTEAFVQGFKVRKDIWDSGDHKDRNTPEYYVQWALTKEFEIPWLDYAKRTGLLTEGELDIEKLDASEVESGKSFQEQRELVLSGWLLGRGASVNPNSMAMTKEKLWGELSKANDQLFRPSSESTIDKFFKKQQLVKFNPGRPKGV